MIKDKEYYKRLILKKTDYKIYTINFLISFLFGGLLCLIGEIFRYIFIDLLNIDIKLSNTFMMIIFILTSAILTGIGVFDKLGQVMKMSILLPISGFSNSVISSTLDYKNEGFITGVASNTLKLAGSVIVVGTISGLLVGILKYIVCVIL